MVDLIPGLWDAEQPFIAYSSFPRVERERGTRAAATHEGVVFLHYHDRAGQPPLFGLTLRSAQPWGDVRSQPMRWTVLPATPARSPLLRVLVERDVEIDDQHYRLAFEAAMRRRDRSFPWLQIYRLQSNEGLTSLDPLPFIAGEPPSENVDDVGEVFSADPEAPLEADEHMGTPYMLTADGELLREGIVGSVSDAFRTPDPSAWFTVSPEFVNDLDRRSVVICSAMPDHAGAVCVRIAAHRTQRGGFAFDIRWPPRHAADERLLVDPGLAGHGAPVIDIAATENVVVSVNVMVSGPSDSRPPPPAAVVRIRRVPRWQLPDLGESLEPLRENGNGGWRFAETDLRPTAQARTEIEAVRMLLGFAGPAGLLIQALDVVAMLFNDGRSLYFGYDADPEEVEQLAISLVVDAALEIVPTAFRHVGRLLPGASVRATVARQVSPVISGTLAQAPQLRAELRAVLTALSQTHLPYSLLTELSERFRRLVAELMRGNAREAILAVLPDKVWLSLAFSPTLRRFKNAGALNRSYLSKLAQLRREGRPLYSALQWARYQTSGPHAARLEELLGANFRTRIARILDARPARLPLAALEHFNTLGGWGAAELYSDLARLNRGRGRLFNADHFFEKRFHNVLHDFLPDPDNMLARLVPANPEVVRQLRAARFAGPMYAHTEKTSLLRQFIPHGSEHLYTLQDAWDAHVAVYTRLGVPAEEIMARLRPDFSAALRGMRADGHRVRLVYRAAAPDDNLVIDAAMGMRGENRPGGREIFGDRRKTTIADTLAAGSRSVRLRTPAR